jgi:hypothetical protein
MSVAAVGLILAVLVSYDERAQREFSTRLKAGPTAEVSEFTETAKKLSLVVVQAAKDQGLAHTPILILVLAGSVLLLFMIRT